MQKIVLSEFVILTVTFSGVFLFISYAILLWTHKVIPPEMLATTQVLVSGAVAAVIAETRQKPTGKSTKQTSVDYALMGVAVTQIILTLNYVFLIWAERSISKEVAPTIGALAITILTLTNFRDSDSNRE
ncbi:MAG: hypothetical protein EAZ18_00250 [Oscillatoriales cyanobacterium]|nr:MAG: hypothetical protein EAZ18_00250 [Oscillatoriales cyanobacterium]